MKNRILKYISIVLIFLSILIIDNEIFASYFNIVITTDKDNQDPKRIVLLLKVKDVNFENTISTIEGNIEYDRNVFSEVKIENLNDWSIVYNNEENSEGKFLGFKINDKEIKEEELCRITFEIKEDVKNANTKIKLTNIKSADGDSLIATEDRVISIDIENGNVLTAKTDSLKLSRIDFLKYILILVIVVLVLTIITSSTYLIQKYKLKKKYNK